VCKFSALVGYRAEFTVYLSGFSCLMPINQCYGRWQVAVSMMLPMNRIYVLK
jgi:hypothetical protein